MTTDGHVTVGACLSLSGRYARFGSQAAHALAVWGVLDGNADILVEDDESDPRTVESALAKLYDRCDVLLGPYSTQLARIAGRVAAERGWLIWNHGGSGDDVEAATPGHVLSVLTPTAHYAEPFVRLHRDRHRDSVLWIAEGDGSFGRQVCAGAEDAARRLGVDVRRVRSGSLVASRPGAPWALFSAGTFEADVALVRAVQEMARPPHAICAVAAGVREFAERVDDVDGIYGVAQWFPDQGADPPGVGPSEAEFLRMYAETYGAEPDYPAAQAVAAAGIAAHVVREFGSSRPDDLWSAATTLETTTLFGKFAVDPSSGAQLGHSTVLVRWTAGVMGLG